MKTSEQITKEFIAKLSNLLYNFHPSATLGAEDHYSGYPECGEDVRMTVFIPSIYDEEGDCISDCAEINLGKYFEAEKVKENFD